MALGSATLLLATRLHGRFNKKGQRSSSRGEAKKQVCNWFADLEAQNSKPSSVSSVEEEGRSLKLSPLLESRLDRVKLQVSGVERVAQRVTE